MGINLVSYLTASDLKAVVDTLMHWTQRVLATTSSMRLAKKIILNISHIVINKEAFDEIVSCSDK